MIIDPSGWKLDGETTLNSKSRMTISVRLLTAAKKRDTKALSCLIVTIWPITLVFRVALTCLKYERLFFFWESQKLFFLLMRLVTSLSNAILLNLSQSSWTTARVAILSISHFRKGLPYSVIMVRIFAKFIKSRLSPMAVWWTELYIMVWIPAYSLNSCTILQRVGAIIKYFSGARDTDETTVYLHFLCSCSMQWSG